MLVGAHASGDAVHNDAEPACGHVWYSLSCCCLRPWTDAVRIERAGKTGCGERADRERAIADGEADRTAGALVKIGMGREKGFRFLCGRRGETVDVMMAVAFGVR